MPAGQKFQDLEGNIPDLPTIIVVPIALQDQWTKELHHALIPHCADIIPYERQFKAREYFFDTVWMASRQPECRKILLCTQPVSVLFYCQTNISHYFT